MALPVGQFVSENMHVACTKTIYLKVLTSKHSQKNCNY